VNNRLKTTYFLVLTLTVFAGVLRPVKGLAQDATEKSPVLTVTDASFESEVLKSKKPVLVDFFAVWCGPCRMYSGVVDQIAQEYAGRVKVVRVDIDQSPQLAGTAQVQVVPTSYLIQKGKAVQKWEGAREKEDLEKILDQVLAKSKKVKKAES